MGRNSALLNLYFTLAPMLVGVSVAVLFPWVAGSPLLAASVMGLSCVVGFTLFAWAKISTIRHGRLFSWGSTGMTLGCRLRYRTGYTLMGFALILTFCWISIFPISR